LEPGPEPFETTAPVASPRRRWRVGLSGKLLVLTILFVMLAEVLIYVPSVANFRLNWLNDRLAAAHTAALVLEAAPSGMVPESLARKILASVGARAVAMKMGNQRRLLASTDMPSEVEQSVDVRSETWWSSITEAFDTQPVFRPDPPQPANSSAERKTRTILIWLRILAHSAADTSAIMGAWPGLIAQCAACSSSCPSASSSLSRPSACQPSARTRQPGLRWSG